jgi:hypothetical protein
MGDEPMRVRHLMGHMSGLPRDPPSSLAPGEPDGPLWVPVDADASTLEQPYRTGSDRA